MAIEIGYYITMVSKNIETVNLKGSSLSLPPPSLKLRRAGAYRENETMVRINQTAAKKFTNQGKGNIQFGSGGRIVRQAHYHSTDPEGLR